jgi:hypothetical protein
MLAWDHYNLDYIDKHGVSKEEAREVVEGACPPFPRPHGGEKLQVDGPTRSGRWLQVIYVLWNVDTISPDMIDPEDRLGLGDAHEIAYVIHARDLTENERRSARKRRGGR